jgi:hypothetical protein
MNDYYSNFFILLKKKKKHSIIKDFDEIKNEIFFSLKKYLNIFNFNNYIYKNII